MKKLQINYTDVWQSEMLLKMGVPAWSADCSQEKDIGGSVWHHKWIKHEWDEHYDAKDYQKFLDREKDTIPCWSVCRLIEIYNICKPDGLVPDIRFGRCENMMHIIIDAYVYMQGRLDFSKLEE